MPINFPLRLTFNTILILLVLKVGYFMYDQSHLQTLYLISFIQDAMLLVINYLFWIGYTHKIHRLWLVSHFMFFLLWLLMSITAVVYTLFLPDLVTFPLNIFGIQQQMITFFLEYFLNVKIGLFLMGGLGILLFISWHVPTSVRFPWVLPFSGGLLTVLFILSVFHVRINPIVYSLQEQVILSWFANPHLAKLVNPVPDKSKAQQFRFLQKTFAQMPVVTSHYQRVVVLVMEGVNYDEFINPVDTDSSSFLAQHREHLEVYHRYHSLNLDSYTSLLVMLNSVFIPYQAYVNETKYVFVNHGNNLVRWFNTNGFSTFFLTSYGKQQERFVPNRREWTQTTYLDNIEENTQFACVTTNKIEYACEDRAVLEDLISLLKKHPRALVFQEMVYGHTNEWQKKTGLGTIAYYNKYFNTVIKRLEQERLLKQTLVVITSDHGPRDDAYNPANYHVPFFVFAADRMPQVHHEFVSHVNFKDILLAFLTNQEDTSVANAIYTIGNSGELVYGMIMSSGNHIFINNRMRFAQGNFLERDMQRFSQQFQEYLNYFEYLRLQSEL